ncbi:MAG: carboxypeptidase-like regulatory domain-containing protein [Bacteroidetes bacterium]|nr:carboxypeptidase-like regulatory domain-containing protein [Bacteroidota bacterium]
MSGQIKHTTHYLAKDIQRYLNGEMTAREMFDMEKAALEDPFLADALEGYEAHPTAAADLNDLQARLHARATNRLVFVWRRIAVAAALFIGLGLSAWYFLLNSKTEQPTIATQKLTPPPQTAPPQTAPSQTAPLQSAPPPQQPQQQSQQQPSQQQPQTAAQSLKKAKTPAPAKPASPVLEDKTTADTMQNKFDGGAAGLAINERTTAPPAAISREQKFRTFAQGSVRYSGEFTPKIFSGRVLDFNNNPLSGATLQLSGKTDVATVTDMQGNFSLKIDPASARDSVVRVNVGMIGYEPSSLAFNTLDPGTATGNFIYLKQQSNSLNEVVVSGYGSKRKETRALISSPGDEKIDSLWISAMPVSGRQAYLDYLEKGKTTIGADSTIKGTVVVSFDVSRKGALSSFKVERSLTPAHDAGVIRLISEGPPWKVSKNRPVRAAVRVTF